MIRYLNSQNIDICNNFSDENLRVKIQQTDHWKTVVHQLPKRFSMCCTSIPVQSLASYKKSYQILHWVFWELQVSSTYKIQFSDSIEISFNICRSLRIRILSLKSSNLFLCK